MPAKGNMPLLSNGIAIAHFGYLEAFKSHLFIVLQRERLVIYQIDDGAYYAKAAGKQV